MYVFERSGNDVSNKEDFLLDWDQAVNGTVNVLEALTDDKLNQAIVEGHNTLGWLGWHLATALGFFGGQIGLQVEPVGGQMMSQQLQQKS